MREAGGTSVDKMPTNKKAIASLVLGIIGMTGVLFVAAIVAIVLGRAARNEIAETGQPGSGLATTGIGLGIFTLAWVSLFLIWFTISGSS